MTRDVEIKACVYDVTVLIERAAVTADSGPGRIEQNDVLFAYVNGRLKLRQFSPEHGELIHYFCVNNTGPRVSSYHIVPTSAPDALCDTLAVAIDAAGRAMKVRQLRLTGQMHIHADAVKGFGGLVEFGVVLCEDQSRDDGVVIVHALMRSLGIAESDLLDVAYAGLLAT